MLAWNELLGGLPPLSVMVGKCLGYKLSEAPQRRETDEEAAARLIGGLTGGR